jgi:cephalosporin hydroxylase
MGSVAVRNKRKPGGIVSEVMPGPENPESSRFEPFDHRGRRCDNLTKEMWEAVQFAKLHINGKAGLSWRGVPIRKNPFDMTLYPMLIWDLKPRTIIELGAAAGASALWMADIVTSFRLDTRIISVDIDLDQVQVKDPRIEFVQFDLREIGITPLPMALPALPHPWLISEDMHKNLVPVLEHFDRYVMPGDYVIVEDTCHLPQLDILEQFMQKSGSRYRVDTHYADNFGYNNTGNWNSWLTCVEDWDTAQ